MVIGKKYLGKERKGWDRDRNRINEGGRDMGNCYGGCGLP